MKKKIDSYKDLEVYKKLYTLNHEMYELTLTFPSFEKYELGSQLRRSANAGPANIAEGWNNKHINLYIEGINRALSEIHETEHHLYVASQRNYLDKEKLNYFIKAYNECGRMLKGLSRSLEDCKKPITHNL